MSLKKFFWHFLRALAIVLATVVAGFFVDRHFVRYYKTEVRPAILTEFESNVLPVFAENARIDRQAFFKSFGKLAQDAEKTALLECGFNEKNAPEFSLLCALVGESLKDANFAATDNVNVAFSGIWAKNDSVKKFSESPYYAKIFAEFAPSETGDKVRYADTEKNFVIVSCLIDANGIPHFDFPISVNGKSLWELCGFAEIDGKLTLKKSAKERLLKLVRQKEQQAF